MFNFKDLLKKFLENPFYTYFLTLSIVLFLLIVNSLLVVNTWSAFFKEFIQEVWYFTNLIILPIVMIADFFLSAKTHSIQVQRVLLNPFLGLFINVLFVIGLWKGLKRKKAKIFFNSYILICFIIFLVVY